MILIVGSDSAIGSALMAQLQRGGDHVVGTTRRRHSVDESHVYLDLSSGVDGWPTPDSVAVAVVCAGVTRMGDCRRDPMGTSRVNVHGVSVLVEKLVADGAFVIFLSTNQVFDGSVPYRPPDDPLCPITEYGRQKAQAERQISRWGDAACIVRLTKVLTPADPLISQWRQALLKGEAIRPFSDVCMAPMPLGYTLTMLQQAIRLRIPGIVQASGSHDIAYAEVAHIGAASLGVDSALVQPVVVAQSYFQDEPLPVHTTLNADRVKYEIGIEPPDTRGIIEMAFASPSSLSDPLNVADLSIS